MRRLGFVLVGLVAVSCVTLGTLFALGVREPAADASAATGTDGDPIARGRYLALAGNCVACHTERGGAPFAGGRAIETPFGRVYGSNLTPDPVTGIGAWTADEFWRALHHGKSKDGRLLYPAFPYPNFTRITRLDADDLYAYLRSVTPVTAPNRAHELRFPYNQQVLLALWRGMYFRAAIQVPDLARDVEWNRGAYLVQGPGHCNACHTRRDGLGASLLAADLAGGMIPMQDWYAPPLNATRGAGLGDWQAHEVVQLLKTGVSMRGSVSGPMAEVVAKSLQHLEEGDLRAMAVYLKSLSPSAEAAARPLQGDVAAGVFAAGAVLYKRHCKDCHGADGRGMPPAYPPLAGNRSLTQPSAANPIRVVLNGGFAPGTAGNPRPYGMPPYRPLFTDAEVAAVVSYIRNAWGNRAALVSGAEVDRFRPAPLD
jgi:mono/diheme cytochrome c family protein